MKTRPAKAAGAAASTPKDVVERGRAFLESADESPGMKRFVADLVAEVEILRGTIDRARALVETLDGMSYRIGANGAEGERFGLAYRDLKESLGVKS